MFWSSRPAMAWTGECVSFDAAGVFVYILRSFEPGLAFAGENVGSFLSRRFDFWRVNILLRFKLDLQLFSSRCIWFDF